MSEYTLEREWIAAGAHQSFIAWLCSKVEAQAQLLESIRAESLRRFNAVSKDATMDNDTEAWLLETAQSIEAYQMKA